MSQLSFITPPATMREAAHRYGLPIREMPPGEKPAERLFHAGPAALSTIELLALVLGSTHLADAEHLYRSFATIKGIHRASFPELTDFPGIGYASAARLQAAFELGRRAVTTTYQTRPQVRSPKDAALMLLPEMSLLTREELRVVILDTKNYVIAVPTVYMGSVNTSLLRTSEVFKAAIVHHSPAVIVAHNHPSGDPTPSPEDVIVTGKLVEASQILDIELLDHLIIGQDSFISLKERGLGFD